MVDLLATLVVILAGWRLTTMVPIGFPSNVGVGMVGALVVYSFLYNLAMSVTAAVLALPWGSFIFAIIGLGAVLAVGFGIGYWKGHQAEGNEWYN